MDHPHAVIAVYPLHQGAEAAVKELHRSGFEMKMLSSIGRDYQTEDHVIGYFNVGDRMKAWGKTGAFWRGLWGMLFGSAFFRIPGKGPALAAGPVVSWIVGILWGRSPWAATACSGPPSTTSEYRRTASCTISRRRWRGAAGRPLGRDRLCQRLPLACHTDRLLGDPRPARQDHRQFGDPQGWGDRLRGDTGRIGGVPPGGPEHRLPAGPEGCRTGRHRQSE